MMDSVQHQDLLSAKAITALLKTPVPASYVQVLPVVSSTNDLAKEQASAGAPAFTTIIAEKQTRGKGRMGRSFYSPPASGIYLSMILQPAFMESQVMLLTTGVAVAAARAIEAVCGSSVQIKWVNDLYLRGKKVAGILVEAVTPAPVENTAGHIRYIVVGIGLNVRVSDEGFPPELAVKAGALYDKGEEVSRNALAAALIDQLWYMVKRLEEEPESCADELVTEAAARSCVIGRDIFVDGHHQLTEGRAVGLDAHGSLLVEDAEGRRYTLSTGEITLRSADGNLW